MEDERLLALINELHAANYNAYGSRRMWKALLREGEQVGRSRVERLMRQNGIQGAKRAASHGDHPGRSGGLRSPDLVKRDFTACRPDEKWFADFTYLRCSGGAGVLQLRDRRLQPHDRRLAVRQPHAHRPRPGRSGMACVDDAPGADVSLVAHSDAGSQYTSYDYTSSSTTRLLVDRFRRNAYDKGRRVLRGHLQDFEFIAVRTWTSRSQLEPRSSATSPGSNNHAPA